MSMSAQAQTAANVAVVINEDSQESIAIGEYYVQKRGVPADNVVRIKTAPKDVISRGVYIASIEAPLFTALRDRGLQDRILYIVLTKGIPLRISGPMGAGGTAASVDSELTLLYRKHAGREVAVSGTVANPYYLGAGSIREAKPFSRRDYDVYLVTRLDAFTVQDARGLVDRALTPVREGRVLLDRRSEAASVAGDLWLADAAATLKELGHGERVDLVETLRPRSAGDVLLGYYSWGSNDPANRRRRLGLGFVAGSIAATLAGTDARTMTAPPSGWEPGAASDRTKWFADGHQSLIADLVREGATGVGGHVADPLLAGAMRPQVLFPAYLEGFNLAESFYLSIPHLSAQSVVLGDPLCRPFEGRVLSSEEIDEGVDERTGLPRFLSNRRIESLGAVHRGTSPDVLALIIRAEGEVVAKKPEQARATLEEVARLAPTLVDPVLQLAALLEDAEEYALAAEQYRRALDLDSRNVVALNNLAYRLAVDGRLDEALPMARRAVTLAPQNPLVLDTLGWVLHLRGDDREAAKYLTEAARLAPRSAEVRWHAAAVAYALGAYTAAETHLAEAVKLDPSLESREEIVELRTKLASRR